MQVKEVSQEVKEILKNAAQKMTGATRRAYLADVTLELCDGNARQAERVFGWGRGTITKGLRERATGIRCVDAYTHRGRKKTEIKQPKLREDLQKIVEPKSQADPKFQTPFAYTRVTAKAVREELMVHQGYPEHELPSEQTIGTMLNRLGYRLKRIQKTKPVKKNADTDLIVENIAAVTRETEGQPGVLRISIDTKAKVKIGEFSRQGKSRQSEAALDHDLTPVTVVVPFGILEVESGHLTILFGTSYETSDLIADGLERWWETNKQRLSHIQRVVIHADNSPHLKSTRTQFLRRMIAWADTIGVTIRLVYYPPYHSKYNPIERCWGILETHWNGTLLSSIEKAVQWAGSMTWKGMKPVVHLVEKVYQKGVNVSKEVMKQLEQRLKRSATLPKWDVIIEPVVG